MNADFANKTGFPRGGSAAWLGDGAGAVTLRDEFFGAPNGAATAVVTGAECAAQAGHLAVTGSASATSPGSQAQTIAGVVGAAGSALAQAAGVEAEALAGVVSAAAGVPATAIVVGVQAVTHAGQVTATTGGIVPVVSGGGPRRRGDRPRFLGRIPDPPKVRISAVAHIFTASCECGAGAVGADGKRSAKARMAGVGVGSNVTAIKAAGMARVQVNSAVIGARPITAVVRGVGIRAEHNEIKAEGLGFTDAEIAALMTAYAEAA